MKTIIVDDEPLAIRNLTSLLQNYCLDTEVVGSAQNSQEARMLIEDLRPNLVFLDIAMPRENGFDLLESMGEDRKFEVIFATAYNEFALKAFKAHAIDYIVKPIDIEELQLSVQHAKALHHLKLSNNTIQLNYEESLQNLLKQMTLGKGTVEKLTVPHIGGFKIIELSGLVYLEGEGNYTILHMQSLEKIVASRQIGHFESLLPEEQFTRIHKSTIINLNYLQGYNSVEGNVALMKDGSKLDISRRKVEEFLIKVSSFTGNKI
jgi:two-component system LytT family response regulator